MCNGKKFYSNEKFSLIGDAYINMSSNNSYGPAISDPDGYKSYWVNNNLHNNHGFAITWNDGTRKYYLNGIQYGYDKWKILK